ncbi:hypothetical protein TNCV_937171 [Trichonephila clavipes]|nr:hypothetical protein TNCV_937171 [Trichonephila clavipes]
MTGLKEDQGEGRTKVTNKRKPHVWSQTYSPQVSTRLKKSRKEVIRYKRSIPNSRSGAPGRKCEEEDNRSTDPTLKIKDTSNSPQARVVSRLREDGQATRIQEEAEKPDSNSARKIHQQKDGVVGGSSRRRQQ